MTDESTEDGMEWLEESEIEPAIQASGGEDIAEEFDEFNEDDFDIDFDDDFEEEEDDFDYGEESFDEELDESEEISEEDFGFE
jgi:hypothetical protein